MPRVYHHPDFDGTEAREAPLAVFIACPADGVAPDGYHATSIFPEYVQVEKGRWVLLEHSRMDCVIRWNADDTLEVVEFRRLKAGDRVAVGRGENGEDGILVHGDGFVEVDCEEETPPAPHVRGEHAAVGMGGRPAGAHTDPLPAGMSAVSGPPCATPVEPEPSFRRAGAPGPHRLAAVTPGGGGPQKFAFRTGVSRETSFSIDYDTLYEVLRHDREHGRIVWVAGPAVVFDADARSAFAALVEKGYVHGLLAGNALAVHDMEGALYGTALGQGIYHKRQAPHGHYHHLDCINAVRRAGSIELAVRSGLVRDGVMRALVEVGVPFVLAGSIRDDGPLPGVHADVCAAQDAMRNLVSRATTVVALATQLHTIATGNMTPSYQVLEDGSVRPVHFFIVDMSEFAAGKLADRGSLSARAVLTNVQDFIVNVNRAL